MPETETAPPSEQAEDAAERLVRGEAETSSEQAEEAKVARANLALTTRGDWTLPARQAIDQAQMQVLRATVAKDCNDLELAMFLEVSARYGLDPFLKHVFAAKFDGANGGVTIFTGRDGLLHAARSSGRFVRMVSAVVREKDEFVVETRLGEALSEIPEGEVSEGAVFGGGVTRLVHKRTGMGDARGPIIGAYALVWRLGDPEPYYAEAPWSEHGEHRQRDNNGKPTTWTIGSKKGFPEQMMRKVPESIALRMGFGITGIVGAEELGDTPERVQNLSDPGGAQPAAQPLVVQYGEDDLGRELRELVEVANELVPGSWRDAKVAMRINGKPDARLKLRDTLRRFIGQRGDAGRQALDRIEQAVQDATVVEAPEKESEAEGEPEAADGGDGRQEGQDGPQDGEEVDGEVVQELPPYDQERHSALVDAVAELRGVLEGMGEDADTTLEGAEARQELESAERELASMNEAAKRAGKPVIEP